jgi:hypothetical protein
MMQDHNKNRSSPALVHNQDRSHVFAEEGIERCISEISLRKEHDTMPMIPLRTKRSDFDTMPMIPLRTKRSDFDTMPMIPLRTKRSDFGTSSTTSLETSKSGKGSTVPVFLGDGDLDLTLILGLERTLFAALNNAWLLAIGGIGLMSVGSDDNRANYAGIVILCGGIISSMIAYGMHFLRVWQVSIRLYKIFRCFSFLD